MNKKYPATIIQQGEGLSKKFSEYIFHLKDELTHPQLPLKLKTLALDGLRNISGKSIDDWIKFADEWQKSVSSYDQDSVDPVAFFSQPERLSRDIDKLKGFIKRVPFEARRLLPTDQTEKDVKDMFEQSTISFLESIRNWFVSLKDPNAETTDNSRMAIQVTRLFKSYGSNIALREVTFGVKEGTIFGLIGPNGAGKTTLIECIEGIRKPDNGSIEVLDVQIVGAKQKILSAIREHMGIQMQVSGFFDLLTVEESLELAASCFKKSIPVNFVLKSMDLVDKSKSLVKTLSGGQFQRLAIGAAQINDPDILFLDEPTTGLDPEARHRVWDLIRKLKEKGKTVFLTTHYMEEAERLCDKIAIINNGTILEYGSPKELINKHIGNKIVEVFYSGMIQPNQLKQVPNVNRSWISGSKVFLISENVQQTATFIVENGLGSDVLIQNVSIRNGNLEDLYLKINVKESQI